MKCPICDKHLAIITIMDYFNGHCTSKKHRCWGTHKKIDPKIFYGPSDYSIHGIEVRKRLANRNAVIRHLLKEKVYEILLVVKKKIGLDDKELIKVRMTEVEYKEKYENDHKALLKLLEMSEVFQ